MFPTNPINALEARRDRREYPRGEVCFQLIQLTHWKRVKRVSQQQAVVVGFPTNPINALEASKVTLEVGDDSYVFPTNPINALEASLQKQLSLGSL